MHRKESRGSDRETADSPGGESAHDLVHDGVAVPEMVVKGYGRPVAEFQAIEELVPG
jgi:hypothetical protein